MDTFGLWGNQMDQFQIVVITVVCTLQCGRLGTFLCTVYVLLYCMLVDAV